jgi:hypothetical protein
MLKYHTADHRPMRAFALYMRLALALTRVRTRREPLGLSEETRYRIAEDTVDALLKDERWRFLGEVAEAKVAPPSHSPDKRRNSDDRA